jgi:hypothetical protein
MFVKGAKRQDKVAIRLQNEYISRLVARIPGIIGNESCYTTTERKTMYIYIYTKDHLHIITRRVHYIYKVVKGQTKEQSTSRTSRGTLTRRFTIQPRVISKSYVINRTPMRIRPR